MNRVRSDRPSDDENHPCHDGIHKSYGAIRLAPSIKKHTIPAGLPDSFVQALTLEATQVKTLISMQRISCMRKLIGLPNADAENATTTKEINSIIDLPYRKFCREGGHPDNIVAYLKRMNVDVPNEDDVKVLANHASKVMTEARQ